jgi:flagellar L-ring protein precursor FlgH
MRSVIIIALVFIIAGSVCAESLWQPEATKSQYADKRAAKVGDIVTVIIVETATSSLSASTDTSKDTSLSTDAGVGPILKNIPALSYGDSDSTSASGSTSRTSTFTTTMTATVTKIDQNGNLEIEGSRFVQTNTEKEEVKLKGTVRPEDVTVDNTVLSTCIADAKITHVGNGPIGSRQKEGIISRIFRIIF